MQKVFNFVGELLVLLAKVTGTIVKGLWKGGIVGKIILFVIVIGLCGALAPRGGTPPASNAEATRVPAVAKVAEIPAATQTPRPPTSTPAPTVTAGPSPTLAPTDTPAPTSTPAPTYTPAPTFTPVPTVTPLPTLSAREVRATNSAATAQVRSQTATAVAEDRQARRAATATQAAQWANWGKVPIQDFEKTPDDYFAQQVVFTGRIFNMSLSASTPFFQMWVPSPGGDVAVLVVCDKYTLEGIYEGNRVIVYGMGAGSATGTNSFGGAVVQPMMNCVWVLKR